MARHYIDNLLGEREKILYVARQHWFILARNILAEIILIFLIFIGSIVAAFYFQANFPLALIILIGFVLLLFPIATMTRDILLWSNRQFIVTNRRVMQTAGVINKSVTDSNLEKVNDVHLSQSAFGRVFNYGDIEILTASELGANLFQRIEKPINFKTAMLNAKERLEHGNGPEGRIEDIPALITRLDQLRQSGALSEEEFQQKKAELLAKM